MASVSHDIAGIFCHASVEHVEEDDEEFEVSGDGQSTILLLQAGNT